MKRYEKISKEEIINSFPFLGRNCEKCLVNKEICRAIDGGKSCGEVVKEWLTQEIETVPRIKNINTKDDLVLARKQFDDFCHKIDCNDKCPYWGDLSVSHNICFVNFLGEEVEV